MVFYLSYFKNQATYTLVTQNKMYNFKILKMKKLLVLSLFVGLVCNTYAFNNVISNSVNDTEQIVFPENTQEVTTAVADFNCDIQYVAVSLSMEKLNFKLFEPSFEPSIDTETHFNLSKPSISLDDLVKKVLIKNGFENEVNNLEQFAKSERCSLVINKGQNPFVYTLIVDYKPICTWKYPKETIKKEGDKFSATYLEFTEL